MFSVLSKINEIYNTVKANNEKCKTLYERLSLMSAPLMKLNTTLLQEQQEAKRSGRSSMDSNQVFYSDFYLLYLLFIIFFIDSRSTLYWICWKRFSNFSLGHSIQLKNGLKLDLDFLGPSKRHLVAQSLRKSLMKFVNCWKNTCKC